MTKERTSKMFASNEKSAVFYQLISSPAVALKSDRKELNTVYSILIIEENRGAVSGTIVYDVTRIKAKGERILSEVIKRAPSKSEIFDFISELL